MILYIAMLLALQPAEIVSAADKVRNPEQPFRTTLTLTDFADKSARDSVSLQVHSKLDPSTHEFRNLVRYAGPPRDLGKLVLFDASSMWFYDPASKASVRISAQQRLIGQASNGDVLTVNLAHDYSAKLLGEEEVQDADRKAHASWHLELTASTPDAIYSRLETWIEKETYWTIKTRFYSDSGRLLKLAYYRNYRNELNGQRPTEVIIVDAVDTKQVTRISYSDFRFEDVQDAWFRRESLQHFDVE